LGLGLPVAILLLTAAVRIRLVDVPLERDEGEYAYAGYALLEAAFGETHRGIHLGLLVVNAGTILLEFLLVNRLCGPVAGVAAAAIFALLSLGQPRSGGLRKRGTLRSPPCSRRNPAVGAIRESPMP
jgi:hypothetical protein